MGKVLVKYRGHLSVITGAAEENPDVPNVEGVLAFIRERYGKAAEKSAKTMLITVNGESILLLKRYKTALKEGDVVNFFPLCAGG